MEAIERTLRRAPPQAPPGEPVSGRAAAEEELAKLVLEVRTGRADGDRRTVEELAEKWLNACERKSLSPTTLRGYRNILWQVVLPRFGKLRVREVTPELLDAFYGHQMSRHRVDRRTNGQARNCASVAAGTVLNYHRLLASMFRQAERWGWVQVSPTRNATPPRVRRPAMKVPSVPEVRRLVLGAGADGGDLMALLFHLAGTTGGRRGELLALRWCDVDFELETISFRGSVYETAGGGVDVIGSSHEKNHERVIAVDRDLLEALPRAHGDRRRPEPKHYVFSSAPHTEPWRPGTVTAAFTRIRRRQGIEGVRFHDLRHFHATQLIAAGMDPVTVSGRLGHSRISTTLDIYTSAIAERDREAARLAGSWQLASGKP